ncbi:hypothetical protein J0X14_12365 [Muricauda sp. CAU 1633]|uniref:hypothetical protein n=1 Tax=Allomuricauda sp. CAU 1633 TaxID=2816036 RepID=UPI001A908492|nr:hypothetical protein [Muricauda sp. CAU 1633]MBO0323093.1 hypothetical protein [Muricauda sp. CAU 1633]
MKKIVFTLLLVTPLFIIGQKKIKTKTTPLGWSYTIAPLIDLPDETKAYSIAVDTNLDPMDFWDELNWNQQVSEKNPEKRQLLYQQAVQDTLNKWTKNYLELSDAKFNRTNSSPDFTITLVTETFTIDSLPTAIDYSNQDAVLGEINVSATLTVQTAQGKTILQKKIPYYIDDPDGPTTTLRLRHFILNPAFKLKLKLTKKPEKQRSLLTNRIKRFEADILESFMQEAGNILKNNFLFQQKDAYGAMFVFKDKEYDQFNKHAEASEEAINSLSALSKKKRKTLEEIRPILESAVILWQKELPKSNHPDVQDALNANIALASLLLDDMIAAKLHLSNIPDVENLDKKMMVMGSSNYYLKGLQEAISIKEDSGDRVQVYQSE